MHIFFIVCSFIVFVDFCYRVQKYKKKREWKLFFLYVVFSCYFCKFNQPR